MTRLVSLVHQPTARFVFSSGIHKLVIAHSRRLFSLAIFMVHRVLSCIFSYCLPPGLLADWALLYHSLVKRSCKDSASCHSGHFSHSRLIFDRNSESEQSVIYAAHDLGFYNMDFAILSLLSRVMKPGLLESPDCGCCYLRDTLPLTAVSPAPMLLVCCSLYQVALLLTSCLFCPNLGKTLQPGIGEPGSLPPTHLHRHRAELLKITCCPLLSQLTNNNTVSSVVHRFSIFLSQQCSNFQYKKSPFIDRFL